MLTIVHKRRTDEYRVRVRKEDINGMKSTQYCFLTALPYDTVAEIISSNRKNQKSLDGSYIYGECSREGHIMLCHASKLRNSYDQIFYGTIVAHAEGTMITGMFKHSESVTMVYKLIKSFVLFMLTMLVIGFLFGDTDLFGFIFGSVVISLTFFGTFLLKTMLISTGEDTKEVLISFIKKKLLAKHYEAGKSS